MAATRDVRFVHLFLLILTCAIPAGCTSYRSPRITVVGAHLVEETEEAIAIRFDLDLVNPNAEALELRQFDYRLSINGRSAYSGRRAAEATLFANGTKHLSIPAVLKFDELGWNAADRPVEVKYSLSGSLLYITPGEIAEILLDTGMRKPRVRFSSAGRVALVPPD